MPSSFEMVNLTHVDLLQLASSLPYAYNLQAITNASTDHVSLLSYHPSFATDIVGSNFSQKLVADLPWNAFHEAGVYQKATGKLYATSNWAGELDNPINVTVIDIHNNDEISSVRYPNLAEANGGSAWYPPGTLANSSVGQEIVFCDEGDLERGPSQLVSVDPATNKTRILLNSFLGRNFSSLNDVKQHYYTGDLWQYFGDPPAIRPQAYRFESDTGIVQAVADDFIAPNGIEFSPDFKHVYITDSGENTFPGKTNLTGPATIYRFDITPDGKRLQNRQLFAYSDVGIPDGIHTDTNGNVYSAHSDGVHVYNPQGILIGKFGLGGEGVNNFAFVPGGLYIFNAFKLWKVNIKAQGRTVKRDFGLH